MSNLPGRMDDMPSALYSYLLLLHELGSAAG
jgi:hypothetical protein